MYQNQGISKFGSDKQDHKQKTSQYQYKQQYNNPHVTLLPHLEQFEGELNINNYLNELAGRGESSSVIRQKDQSKRDDNIQLQKHKDIYNKNIQYIREPTIQEKQFDRQFMQFVISNQFTKLLNTFHLTSISTQQWDQLIIIYYDLILDYFLNKCDQRARYDNTIGIKFININNRLQTLIPIQDDQFRMDVKQYFFQLPLELKLIELQNETVLNSTLKHFYNRSINLYGFIIRNSQGFVKDNIPIKSQNMQLSLYSKQENILESYTDKRLATIKLLKSLKEYQYLDQYISKRDREFADIQVIRKTLFTENLQDIDKDLSDYIQILKRVLSSFNYVIDFSNTILKSQLHPIIYTLQTSSTFINFIKYLGKVHNKELIELSDFDFKMINNTQIDRNISQVQNFNQNFDLRILQQLYKQSFGLNVVIQKAKTVPDFYQLIPINTVPIMQERLRLYKLEQPTNCTHVQVLNELRRYIKEDDQVMQIQILEELLLNYSDQIQKENEFDVVFNSQSYKFAKDQFNCRECQFPIICYHEILQIMYNADVIKEEQFNLQIEQFQTKDLNIFAFSSFCLICGQSFPIKVEMQQIYENIDPLKSYKVIKRSFQILFGSILSSFQFSLKSFIVDFIQHYYYVLKKELQLFKQQSNYQQRKQEITYQFACAYIYSLTGDNVIIDKKLLFKYSKLRDISFEQFNDKIQQIQDQFQIKTSIIIPSMTTVKHLYNTQLHKPIIGEYIRQNPGKLTELLQQQIPIYPTLYNIDKYVQHFNDDIQTLAPQSIEAIVNTSAVDIQNRKSSVVQYYSIVKSNYGRHMERNTHYFTARQSLYGSFLYQDLPIDFTIDRYKELFYLKYCPKTLKEHDSDTKCKRCVNVNIHQISRKQYCDQFYQTNQYIQQKHQSFPVISVQYQIGKQSIVHSYSHKILSNISKEFELSDLQILNFGGFNYLDIRLISKFQTFDQLVIHQLTRYTEIGQIYVQSPPINSSHIPNDLKFILQIKGANFNVYRTRLNVITNRFYTLMQSLPNTQEILQILDTYNLLVYQIKRKGTSNYFVECQLIIFYFFQYIIPSLQQHVNPIILKEQIKQMFKDDIQFIDQYSKSGTFRHKTYKEVNAEQNIKMLQNEQSLSDDEDIAVEQNSDNDNDYIEDMYKNTGADDE